MIMIVILTVAMLDTVAIVVVIVGRKTKPHFVMAQEAPHS